LFYISQKNFDLALDYLHLSKKIRMKKLGFDHPDVAQTDNNINDIITYLPKNELELYLQKSDFLSKLDLGSAVATSNNTVGLIYKSLGKYDLALNYLHKSLNIKIKMLGDDHSDVAETYNNIGLIYKLQRYYDLALYYFHKSLKIYGKNLGFDHPLVAELYRNISFIYKSQGNSDLSLVYFICLCLIKIKECDFTQQSPHYPLTGAPPCICSAPRGWCGSWSRCGRTSRQTRSP